MTQTKLTENIITTTNPALMLGKYLQKPLRCKWVEDFIDKDTGNVVSIDRFEVIFEKGTYLDRQNLPQIEFYLQCGELEEVTVSDQCRLASVVGDLHITPWVITFTQGPQKIKILLWARCLDQAVDIACDYIELSFSGVWRIDAIKSFKACTWIDSERFKSEHTIDKEEDEPAKLYYFITGVKHTSVGIFDYAFLLRASDVDQCKRYIDLAFSQKLVDLSNIIDEHTEQSFVIKSATVTSIHRVIPQEFTQAYLDNENNDYGNQQD